VSGKVKCADVNGDGRVNSKDLLNILFAIVRHSHDPRYDINGDGSVDLRDALAAVFQFGRRCRQ
jgi:hypothetical protein